MADKRSLTSAENGKKGGRKKGFPALEAEKARLMIAEKLATEFEPILDKAIAQAKEGNKDARDWVTDRAYGKPIQSLTGKDGAPLFNDEQRIKIKTVISEVVGDTEQGG